ncbi:MAG: glycosyltransferase family 4 protein [Pseudorhizobium sp.]
MLNNVINESVSDFVHVAHDASQNLRKQLRLSPATRPRIAFLAGPGDAAGTFCYWEKGESDPRTPVIAYSTMFYTLMTKLDAEALLICERPALPVNSARFKFAAVRRDRPPGPFAYRWAQFLYAKRVLKILKAYKPHILLTGIDTPFPLMNAAPADCRILLTAHNTLHAMARGNRSIPGHLRRWADYSRLKRVTGAVCTSREVERQLLEVHPALQGHTLVEVPQVEKHRINSRQTKLDIENIVYLGRLEEDKGLLDLLRAFELIASSHRKPQLFIAGGGSFAEQLQKSVAASPFSHRIHVLGLLDAAAVHNLLNQADLLVCPTRNAFPEGLALVVVEAAAQGVASIASSAVPASELVGEGCLVYPADNVDALAARMAKLIADPTAVAMMQKALVQNRHIYLDRSLSWGSQLGRLLTMETR